MSGLAFLEAPSLNRWPTIFLFIPDLRTLSTARVTIIKRQQTSSSGARPRMSAHTSCHLRFHHHYIAFFSWGVRQPVHDTSSIASICRNNSSANPPVVCWHIKTLLPTSAPSPHHVLFMSVSWIDVLCASDTHKSSGVLERGVGDPARRQPGEGHSWQVSSQHSHTRLWDKINNCMKPWNLKTGASCLYSFVTMTVWQKMWKWAWMECAKSAASSR